MQPRRLVEEALKLVSLVVPALLLSGLAHASDPAAEASVEGAMRPGPTDARIRLPAESPLSPAELYGAVKGSVVMIRTDESLGAGFLVRNRRLVATAFHVISDGGPIVVLSREGTEYQAEVFTYDRDADLAVLELDRDFEDADPLPLRTGADPGVGEPVVMVGHPYGDYSETVDELEGLLTWTITSGIVGAVSEKFVQTDAASSPGNSGGPILDMRGQVLGVVSLRLEDAEGLTFSVPATTLKRLLDNPGNPEPLKRQPTRRFGVGISRFSTVNDLWMDGIFLVFDRSPLSFGPRWGFQVGYNRVDEVPENSHLFHFSEDMYWAQLETGIRLGAPFGLGSFDPFIGARAAWERREALTLLAVTEDPGCDLNGSTPCELNVSFEDGGDRGFRFLGVLGLSWNGDLGSLGTGAMISPVRIWDPRVRWGAWASVWF